MSPIPRIVQLSLGLYRLMLAAYPATFRHEYGEAMIQLFRDTALDAYRRRGALGLSTLWLRTVADFTISVIRQYRDQPEEASSESVLLRDFLHKWRRLVSDALSLTAFSTWYGLHVLRMYYRRSILLAASFTALAIGIWMTSCFDTIYLIRGGTPWSVSIQGGSVVFRHYHDEGEPVSDEEWWHDARAWIERNPDEADRFSTAVRPWKFSFFSGIREGRVIRLGPDRKPLLLQPYLFWQLSFPFGIFPLLLLVWTIRLYLRRNSGPIAAMQST